MVELQELPQFFLNKYIGTIWYRNSFINIFLTIYYLWIGWRKRCRPIFDNLLIKIVQYSCLFILISIINPSLSKVGFDSKYLFHYVLFGSAFISSALHHIEWSILINILLPSWIASFRVTCLLFDSIFSSFHINNDFQ